MSQLEILRQHREALRLAAAGALLHNLGKISSHFIGKQLGISYQSYLYQHILQLISQHCASLPANLWDGCTHLAASDILNQKTKDGLSSHLFDLPAPFNDRKYVSGDLIEYLGQGEPWYQETHGTFGVEYIFPQGSRLTHLMNRAHRGASGGEKQDIATAQQPDAYHLWLSTPFGWEAPASSFSSAHMSTHPDIDDLKNQVEAIIQHYLVAPLQPFPLNALVQALHPLLTQAIADTQRPLNDITIWDIGHTGMALLITQAVGLILKVQPVTHKELAKTGQHNTLFWRVLSVRTNALDHLQTTSIADLRVRQRLLKEAFDRVQQKLESLLLAIEVYRDENGSFYLLPDMSRNDLKNVEGEIEALQEVDGLKLATTISSKQLTSHPNDQGDLYIGAYINQQIQQSSALSYALNTVEDAWSDQRTVRDICTACHLRPQGYGAEQITAYAQNARYYRKKAESRNLCCICMERRSGIAEQWATSPIGQQTVWIDEVADVYGQIALITGHWQFEDFAAAMTYPHTNGVEEKSEWLLKVKFFSSEPSHGVSFQLRQSQFIWDSKRGVLVGGVNVQDRFKIQNLHVHHPAQLTLTLHDIFLQGEEFILEVQEDLTGIGIGSTVKCWGQDFIVESRNCLKTTTQQARNKILQTVLWNQQYPFKICSIIEDRSTTIKGTGVVSQSFARLRRVWGTTRDFWQRVLPTDEGSDISESMVGKIIPQVAARLAIKAQLASQNPNNPTPGDYHVYELVLEKAIKMSVVWDGVNQRFITADNLTYLAKSEQLGQSIKQWLMHHKGVWLRLEEPSGYGSHNKIWGKIQIEKIEEISNSSYWPIIPILAEPRSFMALVPADRSLELLQQIKLKYEREMGKVRNRLPLHLGAVYFSRRTPLRAALDAGQAMIKRQSTPKIWQVTATHQGALPSSKSALADGTKQFQQTITLSLSWGGNSIDWHVPAVMGDGATPDNWYPYIHFHCDQQGNTQPCHRQRMFQDPQGNWLIHAGDLQVGDQVHFIPSTLDFEFLDTTARRFELHYRADGRRASRPTRPFYLEDLDRLDLLWRLLKQLERSQCYQLIATIEATRELWQTLAIGQTDDTVFTQFVHDTLAGAAWPRRKRWDAALQCWVDCTEDDPQPGGWQSIPPDWRQQLIQAGVRGELADVLELRMKILKER